MAGAALSIVVEVARSMVRSAPTKVRAYRFASANEHGACGLNLVVVKKTMSPATAGKAVTFSSPASPSVFSRSRENCSLAVPSTIPTSLYE